jgi:hypothetical protein
MRVKMKMLMYLAKRFTYKPFEKTLTTAEDYTDEVTVIDAAVIFVHCEPQD